VILIQLLTYVLTKVSF